MGVNRWAWLSAAAREDVFPTRVGVNRRPARVRSLVDRIPHACGGEPLDTLKSAVYRVVFPTRVGVNRGDGGVGAGVPRYSPRVWG